MSNPYTLSGPLHLISTPTAGLGDSGRSGQRGARSRCSATAGPSSSTRRATAGPPTTSSASSPHRHQPALASSWTKSRTRLPAQRRQRRLRPGPQRVLHLAGRHRELDRLPRQRLAARRLRQRPYHPRAEVHLERRRHPEPRHPGRLGTTLAGPSGETAATPTAYTLVNRNSGKCLDVAGGSTADGANVRQWTCNGGANQRWRVEDQGDDTSRLVNVASGKVLDTADCATADGADLRQWTWLNNTCQRFRLVVHGHRRLRAASSTRPRGKVADVADCAHRRRRRRTPVDLAEQHLPAVETEPGLVASQPACPIPAAFGQL